MSSETPPEPVEARPWRPDDGPEPKVTMWPHRSRPALAVWSHGKWRNAPVMARQDWADGRVFYQVSVDLRGDMSVVARMYQWPQPGLRVAWYPSSEPVSGAADDRRLTPRTRPRPSGPGPEERPPTGS
ncbi:hypothetical protein AB0I69_42645 [Streptomyces sp. NPDC050508]|uniref:hypothetical protein n=1 Tax=Streptomyces sp. NPDC050508 TaxID=3155405 RepID=UPI0034180606